MPFLDEAERIRRFDAMGYTRDERDIIEKVRIVSANGFISELSYRSKMHPTYLHLWISGKKRDIGHRSLMRLAVEAEKIIEREGL